MSLETSQIGWPIGFRGTWTPSSFQSLGFPCSFFFSSFKAKRLTLLLPENRSYTIHFLKDCVKVFEKSAKDQGGKAGAAEEFIRIGFAELVRKFCMLGKTATVVSTLFPYLIHLPSNNALAEVILSITAASIPEIHRDQFVDTLIKELLKLSLPSTVAPSPSNKTVNCENSSFFLFFNQK